MPDNRDLTHAADTALEGDPEPDALGHVIWHSSGEDEGPDVGISLGLGEGRILWLGEIPNETLAECEIDTTKDDGWWFALYGQGRHDVEIAARVVDGLAARELFDRLDAAISSAKQSASDKSRDELNPSNQGGEGKVAWVLVPREPTGAMISAAFRSVDLRSRSWNETLTDAYLAALSASPSPPGAVDRELRESGLTSEQDADLGWRMYEKEIEAGNVQRDQARVFWEALTKIAGSSYVNRQATILIDIARAALLTTEMK